MLWRMELCGMDTRILWTQGLNTLPLRSADPVEKRSSCSLVQMMPLELCKQVVLASGQPQRAKQPQVHLWPTQETYLRQKLLISGSLLNPVSSPATLPKFPQRILSLISSVLGRALSKNPSAPERTMGGSKALDLCLLC